MANKEETRFILKAVDQFSATADRIEKSIAGLKSKVDGLNKSTSGPKGLAAFGKNFTQVGERISNFGTKLSASVSLPLFFAGKKAVETASNFETLDIALTTMLGSAEKAKQLREELTQFAAKTPFQVEDIGQTAQQLLAVGISQEKLIPTLKSLGDVAAGLNVPLERIVMNYGQVRTQNKLTGREMKDFLVSGIPLIDELAKSLNVKKSAIPDMISAGKITFKEVEKAFQSMTGEGGKFNNLMAKISTETLKGKLSNLADQVSILGAKFGEALTPDIEKFIEKISKLVEWFSNLSPETKKIIARLALFAAVLGPALVYVGLLVQGIGALATAFALLFSPIGFVLALIGAFVAAGIWVWKNWEKVHKFLVNMWWDIKSSVLIFVQDVKGWLMKLWDGPLFKVLRYVTGIEFLIQNAEKIKAAWGKVKDYFSSLWDKPFKSALDFTNPINVIVGLAKTVKDNWQAISDFFVNLWDGAKKSFNDFIDTVSQKVSALGTILDFALFGKSGQMFSDSTVTNSDGTASENTFAGAAWDLIRPSWAPASLGSNDVVRTNNSKVIMDFKNVPRGVEVKTTGSDNVDLNLGYAGI